jgi:hypothetical protein
MGDYLMVKSVMIVTQTLTHLELDEGIWLGSHKVKVY